MSAGQQGTGTGSDAFLFDEAYSKGGLRFALAPAPCYAQT